MFARLSRDNRGVSVITYALILPVFIVLVFGMLEIWRVMSVRQSLTQGVYRAVRELSSGGGEWLPTSAGRWESMATAQARRTIDGGLRDNGLVPQGYVLRVQVTIDPGERGPSMMRTGWLFVVRAEVMLPGLITVPLLDLGNVTLVERQVSYIEGLSGDWTPPPEGAPY